MPILSLYLRDPSRKAHNKQDSSTALDEIKQDSSWLSMLMKEQAEVAGKYMSSVGVAKRHLWLSQSRLRLLSLLPCLGRSPSIYFSGPKRPVPMLKRFCVRLISIKASDQDRPCLGISRTSPSRLPGHPEKGGPNRRGWQGEPAFLLGQEFLRGPRL